MSSPKKPPSYYALERSDVVAQLPRPIGRALDVGCGAGGVGRSLRAAGATRVDGIEILPEAAENARETMDQLVVGSVESALAGGDLGGPYDTICCYDVLEHLVDPAAVLRQLRAHAAPGARLHISIPNARHFSLVLDIVVRGTFGYTDWGHRDSTHLRWYTLGDLEAMVANSGWAVQSARTAPVMGRGRWVDRLTLGRAQEFLALQNHLLATARD